MYALLDALHRQQLEQYEEQEIYELDYHNPVVRDSEVLLIKDRKSTRLNSSH